MRCVSRFCISFFGFSILESRISHFLNLGFRFPDKNCITKCVQNVSQMKNSVLTKDMSVDFVVEIPYKSNVKYEIDKKSGMLRCDRILHTTMFYPGNYGYIPNTLANDGDAMDVLMLSETSIYPMTVIKVRIIGILCMEDEAGKDDKLIVVPDTLINPEYEKIHDLCHVPTIILDKIKHFFTHYKDTEPNKWVKVKGFENAQTAMKIYEQSII